jgi:hypothetical protein
MKRLIAVTLAWCCMWNSVLSQAEILPPTPGDIDTEGHSEQPTMAETAQIALESVITATSKEAISSSKALCVPIPDPTDPSGTARITVTQFEAAKDANAHHNLLLKMVTKYFNTHFTDVIRVNIEYEGEALSGKIGKYEVIAYLSRRQDGTGGVVHECRTIDYVIEDVNECLLGMDKCHDTTVCVNTIGSYECRCKQGDAYGVENRYTAHLMHFVYFSLICFCNSTIEIAVPFPL